MTVYKATQLDPWVKKTEARMLAVAKESTKRVVSQAQRRIPVDTGFARASIVGSLASMPPIRAGYRGDKGVTYPQTFDYIVTIAQAVLGGRIYIGWTAGYVGLLEMGSSRQAPSGFVRISAMEWPRIVNETIAEAKARFP
jgi:hypothetical protein